MDNAHTCTIRGTASSRNAMFGHGNMSLEGRRKEEKVT
jgi:hypothetical protein